MLQLFNFSLLKIQEYYNNMYRGRYILKIIVSILNQEKKSMKN